MSQIVRCTFSQTLYGQVMQYVIHFNNNSDFYVPTTIGLDLATNFIGTVRGFQNPLLHYFNIAIRNMDDATGGTTNYPVDIFGGGFFGTQSIPTNAVMVQIRTAVGGRTGRGRFFIPGLHSGAYESGLYNASTVTSLNSFMTNLKNFYKAPGGTSDLQIGVANRGILPNFKLATDLVVGARPGVQRRRNIGVGI